jgi:WD40 repeat protein
VKIWNIENGGLVQELPHGNFVQSLDLIAPGKLISASYDGTIKTWDT